MRKQLAMVLLALAGCKSAEPAHPIAALKKPASADARTHSAGDAAGISPANVTPPAATAGRTFSDMRIEQEVLLHAALYRAAHESNVGGTSRYFVLAPVEETNPPDLGCDPADFRDRVVAELVNLNAPIAWVPLTWREQDVDRFPGTDQPATRLRIAIFSRDESQATVIGEVGDRTAEVGSSRQGVTATWDGVRWNVDRNSVRVVW